MLGRNVATILRLMQAHKPPLDENHAKPTASQMGTHQGSARPLQQQQQQLLLLLLISLLLRAGYPEPGRQMELLKSCLENFLTVAFCALSPISPDLASSYCFACLCVYVCGCVCGGGGVFPFFSFTDCALRNAFNPSTVSHEILRT